MNAPSTLTGTILSIPSDISQNKDYSFYIVVTSNGGTQFLSSMKQLRVGCTPTLGITESASFVSSKTLSVGVSASAVYTYAPPGVSRVYCSPSSVLLQGVSLNNVPDSLAVVSSASCSSSPCFVFDLSSTAVVSTFKFNVRTFFGTRPDVFFDSA